MVQISSPSSTVITGPESLASNFAENSRNFLCQLTFGTGAYAIGGRILGVAKFTPATALVTSGALLAALALCPSGANQGQIVGPPPQFLGGQCPVTYNWVAKMFLNDGGTLRPRPDESGSCLGPIAEFRAPGASSGNTYLGVYNAQGQRIGTGAGLYPSSEPYVLGAITVSRADGLPDNCGNIPSQGGQIVRNINTGDTINGDKVVDNSQIIGIAPVTIQVGGISTTLNLSFSDYSIHSFSPYTYTVNVGGVRWGFEIQPDGSGKPFPVNPDPELPTDQTDSWKKILDKLQEIKDCVCGGDSPVFKADLLDYLDSEDCMVKKELVYFPESQELNPIISRFIQSAMLAEKTCLDPNPPQVEERLIFAATTLRDGRELFSGDIEPEVVSLRIEITDFAPQLAVPITIYPAADQYKFGSVNFTIKNSNGGGDYVYVFDRNTYLPLPKRGKTGKLRILFKEGISFSVYDTGERL